MLYLLSLLVHTYMDSYQSLLIHRYIDSYQLHNQIANLSSFPLHLSPEELIIRQSKKKKNKCVLMNK